MRDKIWAYLNGPRVAYMGAEAAGIPAAHAVSSRQRHLRETGTDPASDPPILWHASTHLCVAGCCKPWRALAHIAVGSAPHLRQKPRAWRVLSQPSLAACRQRIQPSG
jgi:hypothetical protein